MKRLFWLNFVFLGALIASGTIAFSETAPSTQSTPKISKIYSSEETQDFITFARETSAALAAKDKKLMVMKLTDLEAAWDGNEDKLKPRNEAQWKLIDATLDRGINSLRSTSYDEVKGKQALDDLLKMLTESTR